MDARTPVIAIDGPAAAGKTTVSKVIAERLGIAHVESGRTYRLVAYRALREHVPLTDANRLAALCDRILNRPAIDLYQTDAATARALRGPDVTAAVSAVAKLAPIRCSVTQLTRKLVAHIGGAIVEGRDIGTTVFPHADAKVFLSATAEVRAGRRMAQEPHRQFTVILDEIRRRDAVDATRTHSPMRAAADAVVIDTSALTEQAVIDRVEDLCRQTGATWPVPARSSR